MKIQNPHDKFFKETFGNVEIAKDFLNNYLPENIMNVIDVNTLEPQKDSFINEELQEGFSDMLFRVNINKREGYIYFLFEHKSYTSKGISLQLLKYMIEIWEAKIKKEGINELPMIIPLVIYHGKDNWNIKTTLGELITGYKDLPKEIQKFIPDYEYLIYDLSRYTDEEIKGQAQLRIILTIFRDIFTKDNKGLQESIFRAAEYLQELEDKQTGIEYFETFIKYIFNARANLTKKDVGEIIDKISKTYPEGSELVMTLAEIFRQEGIKQGIEKGMEKGMEKGIQQGERRKSLNYAIKLLTKKFGKLPEDYKEKLNNADIEILDLIIEEIFSLESLDDIDKYL
ncbi:Rpn family recombination-promoting nuclease/putative transposase [Anaerosalibacter sp. Marseille-P3206]|uniref:Rpn family recombination-promoting nuclease/putative transposase n=1 Tax=Anaerosalibacter sp. Marseille-P3206 TaxID=1871005 RepID=UPI0009877A01|nr:Rpn family recombination-promoting nuclease/putative transposase [Anaerosalibacter sp. Marseille-P3206]